MAPEKARSYSLHSMKATVLSWARQCDLGSEVRGEQGHHRQSANGHSVRLYSRDDVWGALKVQRTVVQHLALGWRPLTPQARGAQAPDMETAVHLQTGPVAGTKTAAEVSSENESSSSSSSDSSSSSSTPQGSASALPVHEETPEQDTCVTWLVNPTSGVAHMAARCTEATPGHRRVLIEGCWWRARCGASAKLLPSFVTREPDLPAHTLRCLRKPCMRR